MTTTHAPTAGLSRSLVAAMRPTQWIKNCLIVVAPAAAGILTHATVLGETAIAFAAFCLVSSAVYLLNDVRDIDADRRHPTKRFRAIASGRVSTTTATGVELPSCGHTYSFAVPSVAYELANLSATHRNSSSCSRSISPSR